MATKKAKAARPTAQRMTASTRASKAKSAPASAAKAAAAPTPDKPPKPVKLKRDSFRMPKEGFELIDRLKKRAERLRHPVKKGELLRAGLASLDRLSDEALAFALESVPRRGAR